MKDEPILATCRLHWTAFIIRGFFTVLLVLVAIISLTDNSLPIECSVLFLALAGGFAVSILVSYTFNCISLTPTRIYGSIGFIRSKTLSTPLYKIQSIGLRNGLLGKILGYHTITIDNGGMGIPIYVFKHLAKAEEFVDAVEEQIDAVTARN